MNIFLTQIIEKSRIYPKNVTMQTELWTFTLHLYLQTNKSTQKCKIFYLSTAQNPQQIRSLLWEDVWCHFWCIAEDAVLSACEKAFELIDMRTHTGIHPCMGAVDLIPIYPLGEEVGVEDCAKEARGEMSVGRVCVGGLAHLILQLWDSLAQWKPMKWALSVWTQWWGMVHALVLKLQICFVIHNCSLRNVHTLRLWFLFWVYF